VTVKGNFGAEPFACPLACARPRQAAAGSDACTVAVPPLDIPISRSSRGRVRVLAAKVSTER